MYAVLNEGRAHVHLSRCSTTTDRIVLEYGALRRELPGYAPFAICPKQTTRMLLATGFDLDLVTTNEL